MTGIRTAARMALVALVALCAGCNMLSFKDPMHHEDTFTDAMRQFTQAVRWGNFNGASKFVVDEQRDEFLQLAPEISDVRFTDYEILSQDLNEDRNEATVDVIYTGYRLTSPISRSIRLHQKWKRTGTTDWKVTVELGPMREALGLAAK